MFSYFSSTPEYKWIIEKQASIYFYYSSEEISILEYMISNYECF